MWTSEFGDDKSLAGLIDVDSLMDALEVRVLLVETKESSSSLSEVFELRLKSPIAKNQ